MATKQTSENVENVETVEAPEKKARKPRGTSQQVSAALPDDVFEAFENKRWPARMTKAEAVVAACRYWAENA